MSLVPDITAGTGTESDEKPGWWCLWGCRSRKEHTRWPFPSMGLFSGCPAIWELADPRSTLRRQGGSIPANVSNRRFASKWSLGRILFRKGQVLHHCRRARKQRAWHVAYV